LLAFDVTVTENDAYCYDDNFAMHIPLCCVTSTTKVDLEDIEKEQDRQGLQRRQYVWDVEEATLPQEVAYYFDWHGEDITNLTEHDIVVF